MPKNVSSCATSGRRLLTTDAPEARVLCERTRRVNRLATSMRGIAPMLTYIAVFLFFFFLSTLLATQTAQQSFVNNGGALAWRWFTGHIRLVFTRVAP